MAIFKRGEKCWQSFYWRGEQVQESTTQGNPQIARQMESANCGHSNGPMSTSSQPREQGSLSTCRAASQRMRSSTDEGGIGLLSTFTLEDQHTRVRKTLKLHGCVIHSFRHTFGTRLGEAGADAFTIMRAMGHSSVTVSQKYVHPTSEAMERAFEQLQAMNQRAIASLPESGKWQLPATISATVGESEPELVAQVL
jgi:hypothetical protein